MKKPKLQLSGEDGNIFVIAGRAARALTKIGQKDKAEELKQKVMNADSYDHALQIVMDYVDVE